MATVISGKELSAQLKEEMRAQVATFPEKYGRVPHLVVILVGEDPGSVSYVTGKAKASEVVGIKNTTIRKPDTITEAELLGHIHVAGRLRCLQGADLEAPDGVGERKDVLALLTVRAEDRRRAAHRAASAVDRGVVHRRSACRA